LKPQAGKRDVAVGKQPVVRADRTALLAALLTLVAAAAGCSAHDGGSTSQVGGLNVSPSPVPAGVRDSAVVKVVADESDCAYVRVQPVSGGEEYFVHRDFISPQDSGQGTVSFFHALGRQLTGDDDYLTLRELGQMRDRIPALYRTHPSGHDVVASWKAMAPFAYRGELAWPVYVCRNPECPGRADAPTKEGPLFILPDKDFTVEKLARIRQNPALVYQSQSPPPQATKIPYPCPFCSRLPDFQASPEKYAGFVQRYELPEASAMTTALQNEYERSRQIRLRRFGNHPESPQQVEHSSQGASAVE
jgi:hypothetical protein